MKIKKAFLGAVVILMSLSSLQANPFKINETEYQSMIGKTIVSTGTNARMQKVLAKVRRGDNLGWIEREN